MSLRLVVMGVSGCGKSTVGRSLAEALGLPFVEGDDLHPPRNVALMAAGTPLTDDDRQDWLQAVADTLAAHAQQGVVVSCSALKRAYRDQLRQAAPELMLVHLHGDGELLKRRLRGRQGHYMPPSLLPSQLQTLEPPQADERAFSADVAETPSRIVAQLFHRIRALTAREATMHFTKVILETGPDGRARFREEAIPLTEGKPAARLSALMPSGGLQLRMSPVGFRSDFHCTENPQWLFVLGGQMEIGLQDGTSRIFKAGDHFYSADTLPAGATFDARLHGHWSRQVGDEPLVTAFVRA
jgi:carbohydrate kinase (thermoresistant glucokinase family)